jgi:hypothetical protein
LTEAVVPFRPPGGEAADPITAGTEVPRLGDQFDACQNGILADGREERDTAVKPIGAAAKCACEIESESVDVTNLDPVTQRIHHHLQHARMAEVERISAAGEVGVIAWLVRQQPII